MTMHAYIDEISAQLASAGLENPRREVELFLMHVLSCPRHHLYFEAQLSPEAHTEMEMFLSRRKQREPHQYIIGTWDFLDMRLVVDQRVLIPRPETELLVTTVEELISSGKVRSLSPVIIDVGTGSGNIAVWLARHIPQAHMYATDISPDALDVALFNAAAYDKAGAIWFLEGDLLRPIEDLGLREVDIIVSNPPYVPETIKHELAPELSWEPRSALFAGDDGVDVHRRLIHEAPRFLTKGGFLVMEMGFGQRSLIETAVRANGKWVSVTFHKDTHEIDRVVVLKKR